MSEHESKINVMILNSAVRVLLIGDCDCVFSCSAVCWQRRHEGQCWAIGKTKFGGIDKDPIRDSQCVAHSRCVGIWADRIVGFPGRTVILWSLQAWIKLWLGHVPLCDWEQSIKRVEGLFWRGSLRICWKGIKRDEFSMIAMQSLPKYNRRAVGMGNFTSDPPRIFFPTGSLSTQRARTDPFSFLRISHMLIFSSVTVVNCITGWFFWIFCVLR